MNRDTTSEYFFESKYADSADPWGFAGSTYERARYERTLEALAGRRHQRAFEPGCSIGVLTERLAAQCDEVVAVDISQTAVRRARERCQGCANVAIQPGNLPEALPSGAFDLIVFSEIGYYFEARRLRDLAAALIQRRAPAEPSRFIGWGSPCYHLLKGR